jgi:hypothetical protein
MPGGFVPGQETRGRTYIAPEPGNRLDKKEL